VMRLGEWEENRVVQRESELAQKKNTRVPVEIHSEFEEYSPQKRQFVGRVRIVGLEGTVERIAKGPDAEIACL